MCGVDRIVEMILFLFLFKQKTAYEVRISDWSSDVCSSDLSLLLRTVFQERPVGLPRRATLGHWRVSSPPLATIASSFAIAPPGFGRHAFCGLETSCAAHEALRPFPIYRKSVV